MDDLYKEIDKTIVDKYGYMLTMRYNNGDKAVIEVESEGKLYRVTISDVTHEKTTGTADQG